MKRKFFSSKKMSSTKKPSTPPPEQKQPSQADGLPDQAEEWLRKGNEAYKKEDFKTAVAFYEKASACGNTDAAFALAEHYYVWEGDFGKAKRLYGLCAESGNPHAMRSLAQIYEKEMDGEKCIFWLQKAAEQGVAYAQYSLGMHYFSGKFLECDYKMAKYWLEKSSIQGYPKAAGALSDLEKKILEEKKERENIAAGEETYQAALSFYQNGDYQKAFPLLEKSAYTGHKNAQKLLARCCQNGTGTPKNMGKAHSWLEKAAEHGDADTQFTLALWYMKGEGGNTDLEQAEYWMMQASLQGLGKAAEGLQAIRRSRGIQYYNAGISKIRNIVIDDRFHLTQQDISDALPDFEKAAETGMVEAQRVLASYFLYGHTHYIERLRTDTAGYQKDLDKEKGMYWLQKAVENNDACSMFIYAKSIFYGGPFSADEALFELKGNPSSPERKKSFEYAIKASELGLDAAYGWLASLADRNIPGAAEALKRAGKHQGIPK